MYNKKGESNMFGKKEQEKKVWLVIENIATEKTTIAIQFQKMLTQ